MPLLNATLYDGNTFIAQPDAWWPQFGLAVEVDSREWHLSPQDHARTLERQRRMAQHGIIVLPFTPRQISSQPNEVIAQIRAALAAGRAPVNLRTVPLAA
jgi:very-short-patch-repair endonuclease